MRLQLTVQRHGLPPVQVLWTFASAVRPPLLAAGNSITISQFLEQVNEILPLESEEWGLEDYSVEVRGFECLHFFELNQVLKEDDEVCIRPLQTQDLRFRKISGRHQIAADGKHLVDGVAFGRPFLRRADRPAIRIPPRKRRRITYDEEDCFEANEPINDRQVVVRAGFDDADEATAGDQSDDDADFAPDDEEDEDLDGELEDLQNDLGAGADAVRMDIVQPQRNARSRRSPKGLGLLQLLDENGRPYIGQYNNPLLDLYGQDETPRKQPEIRVRKRGTADSTQKSSENIRGILRDSSASPQDFSRRDSAGSNRSVRFENADSVTPATVRESEDSEDADDGDFGLGEVEESDKENAEPQIEESESSDNFSELSRSSSSTSSEDQLSDDETSSSGSSSSGSSSGSEPEQRPSKDKAHQGKLSDTSSSGSSSSSSSSDSEPETPRTGQKRKWAVHNVGSETPANEAPAVVSKSASTNTLPGNGTNMTRSRNKRRKESKRLSFIKSKGILPAAATKADLRKFEEQTSQPERQELIAVGGARAAFEAKKQDLLTSIAAGGIDVSLDPNLQEKDAQTTEDQSPGDGSLPKAAATQNTNPTNQLADKNGSAKQDLGKTSVNDSVNSPTSAEFQDSANDSLVIGKEIPPTGSKSSTLTAIMPDLTTAPPAEAMESLANDSQGTPQAMESSNSKMLPAPESQHRRSKLDMDGAKRMLFGSLGLRTPKTKEDELKTREKLMKDVKPMKELHVSDGIEKVEDVAAAAKDESWKDKIDLQAVECCYEGIELSTPPFPFVQRWDHQQQRGPNISNTKKRKGKKRKRNSYDYYEDSSYRSRGEAPFSNNQYYHDDNSHNPQDEDVHLNEDDVPGQDAEQGLLTEKTSVDSEDHQPLHDESFEDSVRVNDQLLHETEDASADTLVEMQELHDLTNDLPTLPVDLSTCSTLALDTATKGSVVAFKQLEMSAETSWQPKISEYRTAIVDEILDDGTLSMTLAKRDQLPKDVRYDDQTGERLYSKFEMPGYHDEIGDENNGKIEISFEELINPLLVEAAGEQSNQDDMLQGQDQVVAHLDSIDRAVDVEAHDGDARSQSNSSDGLVQEVHNEEIAEPSEEARQEISELIRDAGWRSSVNHGVIDPQDEGFHGRNDDSNELPLVDPPSAKFHGFSSSPITNRSRAASSPPPAVLQKSKCIHTSIADIAESLPQAPIHSPTRSIISNGRPAIDYPDLPQMNGESEVLQQEAQDRSGLLEDHQIASQDLTSRSSVRDSPSQSIASPTLTPPEKSSPKSMNVSDGADSDESLPELFSQAFERRLSQGRDIKSELSEEEPISPPSRRKLKRNSRMASSQRLSDRDWEPDYSNSIGREDDGASTPRASQPVFSSQIVDLAISSDTVDPLDDSYNDDDSYVLPTGPGWVQKPRMSEPRESMAKKPTTRGSLRRRR